MLLRLVWRSYVVVRPLSTEAATTVKSTRSGGGSGITTSLESGTSTATSTRGRDTIGRRLLRLIYAKRSVVIVISKWKEEGHHVRKYKLNRIVWELRKHKRYKYALEVQTTCAALLHTYVQHKDTAKAESLMEKMSDVVS
ncbi:hypothetical protein H5410_001100 [Solanum commersonii]|uniref:Pentatricopeptide repeat-containing protein n=1 Tax=Solanum commersonii TaxID=4109 RepID=A0A9J6AZ68_SOLCO|nr:hypothetical protein H5410_001100 [Solanum commersonii]